MGRPPAWALDLVPAGLLSRTRASCPVSVSQDSVLPSGRVPNTLSLCHGAAQGGSQGCFQELTQGLSEPRSPWRRESVAPRTCLLRQLPGLETAKIISVPPEESFTDISRGAVSAQNYSLPFRTFKIISIAEEN